MAEAEIVVEIIAAVGSRNQSAIATAAVKELSVLEAARETAVVGCFAVASMLEVYPSC